MKLTDLIVESSTRETTGIQAVDDILDSVSPFSTIAAGLPIVPESSEWVTLDSPTRLVRSFEFDMPMKMRYFINEMLAYQDRMNHHSKMTVLSDVVTVETHTHDVENVTQQDLKLAKFADEVYNDTRFFLHE